MSLKSANSHSQSHSDWCIMLVCSKQHTMFHSTCSHTIKDLQKITKLHKPDVTITAIGVLVELEDL